MKVLWFTNTVLPELAGALGTGGEVSGGWVSALLAELRRRRGVQIAVATAVPGQSETSRHEIDGVIYYCLPSAPTRGADLTDRFAAGCGEVLRDFGPDLVHVHGTEEAYGRFTAQLRDGPPVVVSIQGLVHVCADHVLGGIRLADAMEAGVAGGLCWLRFKLSQRTWRRRGRRELEILAGNHDFIGRTAWDHAHLLAVNPGASYHHGEELLRSAFRQRSWDPGASQPHAIYCSAAHSPMKGFHLVLDAVSTLRKEFPEIEVRVAAAPWDDRRGFGYYGRYLRTLIDRRGLARHVTPLPPLSADQVADELARAAVFVMPSLIENSSNSLAEAMLVGTPCIAALAGGTPSMIEEGRTALGFHPGDAQYLAHCVRRLFTDRPLAARLSSAARAVAAARHDVDRVVDSHLRLYEELTVRGAASGAAPREAAP